MIFIFFAKRKLIFFSFSVNFFSVYFSSLKISKHLLAMFCQGFESYSETSNRCDVLRRSIKSFHFRFYTGDFARVVLYGQPTFITTQVSLKLYQVSGFEDY